MDKRWIILRLMILIIVQIAGCTGRETENPLDPGTTAGQEISEDESTGTIEFSSWSDEEAWEQPEFKPADLACKIPDGFEEQSDEAGLYLHKSFPEDISSISYIITQTDDAVMKMTREDYREAYARELYDVYGDEVDIIIHSFEHVKVDQRNAIRITLEYELKGVTYEQLNFMIFNGDEDHIMSYTQEAGGKWMEEFEKCAGTLHFVDRE